MSEFKEELKTTRRNRKNQDLKNDLEKVDIATFLCNNCTVEQMRRIKHQAVLIVRKSSKS